MATANKRRNPGWQCQIGASLGSKKYDSGKSYVKMGRLEVSFLTENAKFSFSKKKVDEWYA